MMVTRSWSSKTLTAMVTRSWSSKKHATRWAPVALCAAGVLTTVAGAWAATNGAGGSPSAKGTPPQTTLIVADSPTDRAGSRQVLREDTEIVDTPGEFHTSGDRIIFVTADGKRRLVVLENLNLQRIARTIAEAPERLQWRASGVVTEYQGANYLIVRRVILKDRVRPDQDQP